MMRAAGFLLGFTAVGLIAASLLGVTPRDFPEPPAAAESPAPPSVPPEGRRTDTESAAAAAHPTAARDTVADKPLHAEAPAGGRDAEDRPEHARATGAAEAVQTARPPEAGETSTGPGAPQDDMASGKPADLPATAATVIWAPFHSERAARGFAEHLGDRYRVATSVRRDGPGRYLVVLDATDEALADQLDRLRTAGLDVRSPAR